MTELAALLITFVVLGCTVALLLGLSSLLGPKSSSRTKDAPFECGFEPLASPGERRTIRFYLIAILFVLFDIEIVFLFPYAAVLRRLGPAGFFSMALFLAVIALGLIYAWKRGALEWD